jgi:hypothetical protein
MNLVRTCLVVLVGFVVGAMLYHPQPTKANDSGAVSVKRLKMGRGSEGNISTTVGIYGSNVVGFSCTGTGDDVQCFIASR